MVETQTLASGVIRIEMDDRKRVWWIVRELYGEGARREVVTERNEEERKKRSGLNHVKEVWEKKRE